MKTSQFDYHLPPSLIAQHPSRRRSDSRMLVLNRADQSITDSRFGRLPEHLDQSFFIVFNDSRVFKARLVGHRISGGMVEVFLVRPTGDEGWLALLRPSARIKRGEKIFFDHRRFVTILDDPGPTERMVAFPSSPDEHFIIGRYGRVPLPPYITREAEAGDRRRYQTVFARATGSVAAPTAGLHFNRTMLSRLAQASIDHDMITLHVGPGTFRPVVAHDIEQHIVDPEFAVITPQTALSINRGFDRGKKLLAVGTTTVRTLETAAARSRRIAPWEEMVDLFIYPPYQFRVVDALLTNFHLPRSSLLMLVAAFCGREFVLDAYQYAVRKKYRFYSYGDCMLIL